MNRALAKKLIYRCLKPFGFDIPRRHVRTSLWGAVEHLRGLGFRPGTVIDVGVAYGTHELYETFPEARQVWVEPLTEFEPTMRKLASKYQAEIIMAAAGAEEGEATLHVHPDLIGTSLLEESEGAHADGVPRQVPVVRLDHVCRERRSPGPYLLKMDTQGAELQVLLGADGILPQTEVIIMEVMMFEMLRGCGTLHEILPFMAERGFVAYDIFGNHARPLDGALAQVDMVFVKRAGRFRASHHYASREGRAAMDRPPMKVR